MARTFTHLHVHTQYSLLDGAARLKDMFEACQEMGMSHLAVTDHGNLHGAYDFHHQAQAAGVTPIIGIEAYVAPGSRRDKRRILWGQPHQKRDDVSGSGGYTHKTIWAADRTGLHNLFRLSSDAYQEGWLGKWPRTDKETIARHREGLIASTGCPSGEVQTRLRLGQPDEALAAAADYRDIFGRDGYFLELMDHGIEIERRVRDGLLEIGRKLGIPPLVTNDSHYTYPAEAAAHDALLCIQTGKNLSDPDRFRFDGSGYYLKSADEMYAVDSSDAWQQGCANTALVAERVDTTGWFEPRNLLPRFDVPEGYTEVTWFRAEAERGLARRYPAGVPRDRREQAEYEMDVIIRMGFPGYFLVVADFIMWAKDNGIAVGPGRGSAAGSIVAYAMGITDLDPIDHGLIFERFLNPERVSLPDVDIDFDERRRAEVIRYVTEKYGADKVAMIGTYGTIKAKNAIKDSARVLGYPYAMGDRITKAMPADVLGKGIPLSGITRPGAPAATARRARSARCTRTSRTCRKVIDTARGVEGLVRQMGVHAAGVIMSSEAITDHVPVWVRHSDGVTITQWDYPQLRVAGPAEDGLPRPAQSDDHGRRRQAGEGQHRPRHRTAVAAAGRRQDVRTAGPRRHAGRLPVRRRADALPAAHDEARPLRGHLRRLRALPAGTHGHELAHQLRAAQERPAGDHPDPPGVGGAAQGGAGRHLRPDRLPGAGAEGRAGAGRVLTGPGRSAAPGDGQEEAGGARPGVHPLPAGRPRARLLRRGRQGGVGRAGPLRRLRVQQGALLRLRPGLVLERVSEGQPPGRVHGGAAHLGARRQGQVGGLPQRVPPDGHQGAAARRQRVGRELHRPGPTR